jgi:hypothetical protein
VPYPQHASSNGDAPPQGSQATELTRRGGKRLAAKPLLIGLLAFCAALVVVAVLLQVFVARRTPELTAARLEAAQQLWSAQGPGSYDMDIEIRGAQPGHVHLEVRDGSVTAMTRDGRSPPQRTWNVWTVPGQFETLERELDLAEDPQHEMGASAGTELRLQCEFDPKFGFPRRYHRFTKGNAPEVFWHVTAFEPK